VVGVLRQVVNASMKIGRGLRPPAADTAALVMQLKPFAFYQSLRVKRARNSGAE
jgi:hypothetical protein